MTPGVVESTIPPTESGRSLFDAFLRDASESGPIAALRVIRARLPADSPQLWLDCARCMIEGGHPLPAAGVLESAAAKFQDSLDVRYWLAMALWHADEIASAEAILRGVIGTHPTYADAARQLAKLLRGQGRMEAATAVMETLHAVAAENDIRLECVRFIEGCQRQNRAAALIEKDIVGAAADPVLLVAAGQLAQQCGRFHVARKHFLAALHAGIDLNAWFVTLGLADTQRYESVHHPDFALFERVLGTPGLSQRAHANVLFALAKAYDDIGDYARATAALREANLVMRAACAWSRADWRAQVAATIRESVRDAAPESQSDVTPIFVVGLPRTGTTLLAELLGRHPQVRNRGELPTLPFVARDLAASGRREDPLALNEATTLYSMHLRQDDAPVRAYVDKNPLNFRYLGLIARLLPQARIIHCRRDIRDTALSLWSHVFAHEDYGFTYDFEDIAAFSEGHDRLMAHWKRVLPLPVLDVDYEDLVTTPATTLKRIVQHAGLPEFDPLTSTPRIDSVIASTSWWQARQPIYQRSVQRWAAYAPYVPELTTVFRDYAGSPTITDEN